MLWLCVERTATTSISSGLESLEVGKGKFCRTLENDLLGSRSRDPLPLRDLWRRPHSLFLTGYSTVAVYDEKQHFFLTSEST